MRTILERQGYRVLTASDGNLGLALAEREAPHLVIVDMIFGVAKHEWIGLPVFLIFVAAFVYLGVLAAPRCPACRTAIHAYSFGSYPNWVPGWFARLIPRYRHCLNCGLSFSTPLNEVGKRAL